MLILVRFPRCGVLQNVASGRHTPGTTGGLTTISRQVVPSLSFKLVQLNEALTSEHKKESTIMTHPIRFVGMDVGKSEIHAYDAKRQQHLAVPNTAEGHQKIALWLGARLDTIIALEPTGGYEWSVWEALCSVGFDVRQVCASHVRAFARATGTLAKTDPIDARLIARFIAFRPDAGRSLPPKDLRDLRALNTKRRQLVEMRKRVSCQMQQHRSAQVIEMDQDLIGLLAEQITALEEQIARVIAGCPRLAQRAQVLRSIPGIGPVITGTLISDLPELGHCTQKQIAALVGLAPINHDSGDKAGRRSIRGGRGMIRNLLYQAALVASLHNPHLKAFAMRLKEKHKPHKVILVAVARKLLAIANLLVARNEHWNAQ